MARLFERKRLRREGRRLPLVERVILVAGIFPVVIWIRGLDGRGLSVPIWAPVLGLGLIGAVFLWRWLHRDARAQTPDDSVL